MSQVKNDRLFLSKKIVLFICIYGKKAVPLQSKIIHEKQTHEFDF